ncbi:hypothetical protein V8F06_014298 [Rhypophila decipiens]
MSAGSGNAAMWCSSLACLLFLSFSYSNMEDKAGQNQMLETDWPGAMPRLIRCYYMFERSGTLTEARLAVEAPVTQIWGNKHLAWPIPAISRLLLDDRTEPWNKRLPSQPRYGVDAPDCIMQVL